MADTNGTPTGANSPSPKGKGSGKSKPSAKLTDTAASPATTEARSRFNSALEEARAGVAALGTEARERAAGYTSQAKSTGTDYAEIAKEKAGELAVEGKARASGALTGLGKLVADNAPAIDEKLGAKYGDYARTASRSLTDTATKLESKSVEELGADAREMVRKSPGTAVALASLVGFMFARLLSGK